MTVQLAARTADTWPCPWRGDPIPAAHPLRNLQTDDHMCCQGWWEAANGERRTYYVDACRDDWYGYAVLAVFDHWGASALHVAEEPAERRLVLRRQITCQNPACRYVGEARSFPCPNCHAMYCPECGWCGCDLLRSRQWVCARCRLSKDRRLFKRPGLCLECERRGDG
jgi:hypothetical protein